MITIGIDPHKRSITAAALDKRSHPHAQVRVQVGQHTIHQLLAFAAAWPQRCWAVEGATGLGRSVAQGLVAAGEQVLDVPAKLAARARLLGSGSARKTDVDDAISVASVALHHRRLNLVSLEDDTLVLRLLTERREDLVAERTRALNRLHVLLRDLHPGGADRQLSTVAAAGLLRAIQPLTSVDARRKALAKDLLADCRRLDRHVKTATSAIRAAVEAHGTTLTEIHGVSYVLAAKILGHVGNIRRFATRDHFASYTGTAPIEASSGDLRRHRLNRGGNRQLNTALHTIAICQIRDPGPGQTHYQRKLTETKTPTEARRSLKRQLANVVYHHLVVNQRHRDRAAG